MKNFLTVKEMIVALQALPEELPVVVLGWNGDGKFAGLPYEEDAFVNESDLEDFPRVVFIGE